MHDQSVKTDEGVDVESQDTTTDRTDSINSYGEYNRILRTWFVAFGAGGPALLIAQRDLATALSRAGELRCVAILFLFGTAAQVLGAMINKYANYEVYLGTLKPELEGTRRQRLANRFIEFIFLDIAIDLATVVAFGLAVWRLLIVVGRGT